MIAAWLVVMEYKLHTGRTYGGYRSLVSAIPSGIARTRKPRFDLAHEQHEIPRGDLGRSSHWLRVQDGSADRPRAKLQQSKCERLHTRLLFFGANVFVRCEEFYFS